MSDLVKHVSGLVFDDKGFEDFRRLAGEVYTVAKPNICSLVEINEQNAKEQLDSLFRSYLSIGPEYARLLFKFVMKQPVDGRFPSDDDMEEWMPEPYASARECLSENTRRWMVHTFNDMRLHHYQTLAALDVVSSLIYGTGVFQEHIDLIVDSLTRLHIRLEFQLASLHNIAKLWPRKKIE